MKKSWGSTLDISCLAGSLLPFLLMSDDRSLMHLLAAIPVLDNLSNFDIDEVLYIAVLALLGLRYSSLEIGI